MQVQSASSISYRPHFSGVRLFSARVKTVIPQNCAEVLKGGMTDAFITKLDESDFHRINNDFWRWTDSSLGKYIIEDFLSVIRSTFNKAVLHEDKFFVLEIPSLGEKSICGLAEINSRPGKSSIELTDLQSSCEMEEEPFAKGVGSCLMFAFVKMAQLLKKSNLFLRSYETSENFYKRLGLKPHYQKGKPTKFTLTSDKFESLLKNLQEKYEIKPLPDADKILY